MEKLRDIGKSRFVGLLQQCCNESPKDRPTFKSISESCGVAAQPGYMR
jgi:hypothetical protein